MPRPVYPPPHHILSHLRLHHRSRSDGGVEVTMPVLADLLDEHGWLRIGALAVLVDSAAGHHAVRQVAPDWVATLDLETVLARRAMGDVVTATCHPVRIGRNTVVTETEVVDGDGTVATSLCTYARLPARDGNPAVDRLEVSDIDYAVADEEPRVPLDEYLRMDVQPDRAVIELEHHPRIHNSFGSIQGGAVCVLVERATERCAELLLGAPTRCVEQSVHYLSQAKGGPFRVEATPLRVADGSVTARVTLHDTGAGRLLDVATATADVVS